MSVDSLIGRKLGMTSVIDTAGVMHGVTVLEVGPNSVVCRRTTERDGYDAVALGFGAKRPSRARKPQAVQAKAAGLDAEPAVVREVKVAPSSDLAPGASIGVADVFSVGDYVDVVGTSRGMGFQGVRKRHKFNLGPHTHGSKNIREPGSTGHATYPSRVMKGKRMPGHMGNERSTVRNLKVVKVDAERNLVLVAGPVPGWETGTVLVRKAVAKRVAKSS